MSLMGFSDYFVQSALVPGSYQHPSSASQHGKDDETDGKYKLSDQEILESTEKIYFEDDVNTEIYELKVKANDTILNMQLLCGARAET